MKFKKLILPLAMLLAIPSCGSTAEDPAPAKGGEVPSGGTKITDVASADQELADLIHKFNAILEKDTKFEMKGSFDGFTADINSGRFNSNLSLDKFDVTFDVDHLFKEDRKDLKGALSFTGSKLRYKVDVDSESEDVEEVHWDESVEYGKFNAYLAKGNLYLDATEAKPFDTIKGTIRALEPLYTALAEQNMTLKLFLPVINLLKEADTEPVEKALDEFGNKFVFEGVSLDGFASFAKMIKDADNGENAAKAALLKESIKNALGLSWDNFATIYTYEDGSRAIELKLTEEDLIKMINPEDVEIYDFEFAKSFLKLIVCFNKKGQPYSVSYAHDVEASMGAEIFTKVLGSALALSSKGGFDLLINSEAEGEVEVPSDLNSYKKLSALLVKLAPFTI